MAEYIDLDAGLGQVIGAELRLAQTNLTAPAGSAAFDAGSDDESAVLVGPDAAALGGIAFLEPDGSLTPVYDSVGIADAQQAAQDALDAAATAQATADGKNKVFASQATPLAENAGDLWYQLNESNRVISVKVATAAGSSSWQPYTIAADQVLVAGSVGTVQLADGAITADKIRANTITAAHLSADVGKSLDISANDAVNILVSKTDATSTALSATTTKVNNLSAYFSFDATGLTIGQPGNSNQLRLTNDQIQMLGGAGILAYWQGQTMTVDNTNISSTLVIGNHQFKKDPTTGRTLVKKVG